MVGSLCHLLARAGPSWMLSAEARELCSPPHLPSGFIFDLIQCILMRNFLHPTLECAPTLYARIVQALRSESKTKVVVVAHSQGAIITSLVLDQIIVDMDAKYLKKVGILFETLAACS